MHLHHPVAKVKRQKLLKQEITKVRRKLSMGKAGTTPGGPKHPKQSDKDTEDEDKHKKKKPREVSPLPEDNKTPGRRLRAGKEVESSADQKKLKRGRKRKQSKSNNEGDDEVEEGPPSKKKNLDENNLNKTPVKSVQNSSSPAKSPAGVNRRNAVLFTRKKQAAVQPSNADEKTETLSNTKTDKKNKKEKVTALSDDILENQETEVQGATSSISTKTNDKTIKKRGRKPKQDKKPVEKPLPMSPPKSTFGTCRGANAGPSTGGPAMNSTSFRAYRKGGDIGETDEETHSESATDALATSEDDGSDEEAEDSDASDGVSSANRYKSSP